MSLEAHATPITVSEVYDRVTIQGEGPTIGRPATFVRLGLCNLSCKWCDTPFTWDWTGKNGVVYDKAAELERTTVGDVLNRLVDAPRLVITGGEPLVQQRAVLALATLASREREMAVEIETNGTIAPSARWAELTVQWNISPKLAHSGDAYIDRINHAALAAFAVQQLASFKFVCQTASDVDEAFAISEQLHLPRSRVWIMPEGVTSQATHCVAQAIIQRTIDYGFSISPRLHVDLWGSERGR